VATNFIVPSRAPAAPGSLMNISMPLGPNRP
jgi:hypothetical protein